MTHNTRNPVIIANLALTTYIVKGSRCISALSYVIALSLLNKTRSLNFRKFARINCSDRFESTFPVLPKVCV